MDLHRRFVAMYRKGILTMDVLSFIEMKFTELSVFYLRIIGVDSGGSLHQLVYLVFEFLLNQNHLVYFTDPGIGSVYTVPLDHLDVCKPRNRNCFLYRRLAKMIDSAIHAHTRTLLHAFDIVNQ